MDMDIETVANRALTPGEATSEHTVMQAATNSGRLTFWLGAVTAALPQILDIINALPDALKQNKVPQIILAVLGGLVAMLGIAKDTQAKVAYINGRSLLKATALKDVPPTTLTTTMSLDSKMGGA